MLIQPDATAVIQVENVSKLSFGVPDYKGRHVVLGPGQSKAIKIKYATYRTQSRWRIVNLSDWPAPDKTEPPVKSVPAPTPINRQPKPKAATGEDDLIAKANMLGITVDGRWGRPRLLAEIEKAMAEQNAVHNANRG